MLTSKTIRGLALAGALATAGALPVALSWGLDAPPAAERVSVSSAGAEGGRDSTAPSVSDDGRYVAFASDAENLVPNDGNHVRDIFVKDRQTGAVDRASVSALGVEGNAQSGGVQAGPARVSADGRYVVFSSSANNLVPNDGNGHDDVFIRDRMLGTTERVSLDSTGAELESDSITPSVSADGRYVTFSSNADNVVPLEENHTWDVFLRDRMANTTELISIATDGTYGNLSSGYLGAGAGRITPDGRYVVFGSYADNLTADDENTADDIFVRDRELETTERVSVSTQGTEGDSDSTYGDISDDGQLVVFYSLAENLIGNDENHATDVFLRDLAQDVTSLVSHAGDSPANASSNFPSISGDGHFVVFESTASDLVLNDSNGTSDVFSAWLDSGTIERISAGPNGEAHGASLGATVSGDGSVVAFESIAPDLVAGDGNDESDAFAWGKALRVPPTATPTRTATPIPPLPDGDVNGDGVSDSLDGLLVLQYSAQFVTSLPQLQDGDVNRDGRIDALDAALILQYNAGLLSHLPV